MRKIFLIIIVMFLFGCASKKEFFVLDKKDNNLVYVRQTGFIRVQTLQVDSVLFKEIEIKTRIKLKEKEYKVQ
jgi:uncharacterized lipoprotein YmbA